MQEVIVDKQDSCEEVGLIDESQETINKIRGRICVTPPRASNTGGSLISHVA